jgi:NAD dependent epimerase/dehydratase family enzyme
MTMWALNSGSADGAFNATAPEPVTNRVFSAALGHALRRPSWLPVPAPALGVLFGELAGPLLIRGQRVIPGRALAAGFTFAHPGIDDAMTSSVGR